MREFKTFHPFVTLFYFASVVGFTMFQFNPILLILSLVLSIVLSVKTLGIDDLKKKSLFIFFFFSICVLANVLFVHKGVTPLFYINDNAITLEALVYGIAFSSMLISVIFWFNSFNSIMSSDKIIYLFSTLLPTIGLIISMILRFIPRFQKQLKRIMDINNVIGDPRKSSSIPHRLKTVFRSFSILLTWSFENSIDTADSMKARGYGLKNRTTFHLYKFDKRDLLVLAIMIGLTLLNVFFYFKLDLRFYYYPEIAPLIYDIPHLIAYFTYSLLLLLPIIIEVKEEIKWKSLISKI